MRRRSDRARRVASAACRMVARAAHLGERPRAVGRPMALTIVLSLVLAALGLTSTTTGGGPEAHTYDEPASLRVHAHVAATAAAGRFQIIDERKGSASRPAETPRTPTTPSAVSGATNTVDDEFVYRVHGGESGPGGHSWTTENPLQMSNPRDRLGLPKVNSGEYVSCARVCNSEGVVRRDALPLDRTKGGGPELLFPDPARQLEHVWTVRVEPPL
jgi:hypothetical protein